MKSLGMYPHVATWHSKGVAYRLVPNTTLLAPTKEVDWKEPRHIYPPMFLGTNATVLPEVESPSPEEQEFRKQRSRQDNRTDESAQSGDSDSANDDTGVVFYQLGALQYCLNLVDAKAKDPSAVTSANWVDSSFVIVVKIGATGKSEDVYIM
jgi:hypothetical protein